MSLITGIAGVLVLVQQVVLMSSVTYRYVCFNLYRCVLICTGVCVGVMTVLGGSECVDFICIALKHIIFLCFYTKSSLRWVSSYIQTTPT